MWVLVGILLSAVAYLFWVVNGLQDAVLVLQEIVITLQDTIKILQNNHSVLNNKIIPKLEKIDELTKENN